MLENRLQVKAKEMTSQLFKYLRIIKRSSLGSWKTVTEFSAWVWLESNKETSVLFLFIAFILVWREESEEVDR